MKHRGLIRQIGAGAAIALALGAGYFYLYHRPMASQTRKLDQQLTSNRWYEGELKGRTQVTDSLKLVAASTLGSTADQCNSRLRGALRVIAEGCGIADKDILINTRNTPVEHTNPAGTSRLSIPSGLRTALRKQRDFWVIEGDIEATGSLDQVLRIAAVIQKQSWVHRVDSFSLKPEGKDRSRFALKLGVATLFLPDLAPKDAPDAQITLLDERARQSWAAIVDKNVFKEPPPVAAAAQGSAPAPRGPEAPAYNDWKLTGVIESRLGIEALLVNVRSQERMSLPAGSVVAEARFLTGAGERAVFEIGGEQFEVTTGQTLAQRRPAAR